MHFLRFPHLDGNPAAVVGIDPQRVAHRPPVVHHLANIPEVDGAPAGSAEQDHQGVAIDPVLAGRG